MSIIRYYNNPGYKDPALVEDLKSRPGGKHYHYVEQGRRLSEQPLLKKLLQNLQPGTVFQTEDLTTFVGGSVNTLVDVLCYVVRKGGAVETAQGLRIDAHTPMLSLDALARYRTHMHSAIRKGTGRPRSEIDLAKAKMLRAQGLTLAQVATQLGVNRKTLDARIREEKKLAKVLATDSST